MNFLHVYVSFGGMLFLKPLSCSAFVVIMIEHRNGPRETGKERKIAKKAIEIKCANVCRAKSYK